MKYFQPEAFTMTLGRCKEEQSHTYRRETCTHTLPTEPLPNTDHGTEVVWSRKGITEWFSILRFLPLSPFLWLIWRVT